MHLLQGGTSRMEHTYAFRAEPHSRSCALVPTKCPRSREEIQDGVRTTGSGLHVSRTKWRAETQWQGCARKPHEPPSLLPPTGTSAVCFTDLAEPVHLHDPWKVDTKDRPCPLRQASQRRL